MLLLLPLPGAAQTGPTEATLLALDSSGDGNHGTLVPSVVRAPGWDNRSVYFDGLRAFGVVSANDTLNATSAVTVAVWANRTPQSGTGNIVRRDNQVIIQAGGETTTNFFVFVNGAYRSCTGSHPSSFNVWRHYALTYSSTEKVLRGYVDGAVACSSDLTVVCALSCTVGPTLRWLHFGAVGSATSGDYFAGGMDELRLYSNRSLSDAELDTVINGTATGTDDRAGMTVWLRFDEEWDYGPPVAAWTAVAGNLTLNVDASGSSSPWPGGSLSYAWDWGDGSGVGVNVTDAHRYDDEGAYTVTLTVTDAVSGQVAVSSSVVYVPRNGVTRLETAFDQWIPIIVWGGVVLLFVYFVAWFPAVIALVALGNAVIPLGPFWSEGWSAVMVLMAFIVYALVTNGLLPVPWRKAS